MRFFLQFNFKREYRILFLSLEKKILILEIREIKKFLNFKFNLEKFSFL